MVIVVCPGMHPPHLTEAFLQAMTLDQPWHWAGVEVCVVPGDRLPVYSPLHVLNFLQQRLGAPWAAPPVLFIGFSAGVVGAIAAAHLWQGLGGKVAALIALDGWGVPLGGDFPIHRLSHDYFTDWSSALLDAPAVRQTGDRFYAAPPVEHWELWRSPQTAMGWWHSAARASVFVSATQCLQALISRYA
ncbi:MAG: hypothetical protein Fur0046_10670 [Cyanobacteria bacterium J069]|nr:MAG: hypothetical protein D6742_11725 [Cyanobacteria bacterium J069]